MGQGMVVKRHGRIGKFGTPLRIAVTTWKRLVATRHFMISIRKN